MLMPSLSVKNLVLDYPLSGRQAKKVGMSSDTTSAGSQIIAENGRYAVRAINDISFSLDPRDRLAVIGHNGSGKSTLLMALAGIYKPTRGEIRVEGSVDTLFNIRLGFNPEATGRRNIVIRGLMRGLSHDEIQAAMPEIAEASGIGSFIDLPFHTYSAGMAARLAFVAATAFHPDILLLDEWIGAGDANFRRKSRNRLKKFVGAAGIVVLASHNTAILKDVCNKGLVMEAGRMTFFGPIEAALRSHDENYDEEISDV
ncbi:ATP-binding cassette domain-containing protein [Rhizobium leguminosarum]|uniref:ABC transporter ATP-binding protein n=1 Tax=Rhizobium leguminosarum TaxID=384 RepID=UPI003ECC61F2